MAGFTNAEEVDILELRFAGTALPNAPTQVALYTVAPGDDGTGGTEATGGSYARKAYAANNTNWGNTSAGAPSTIKNLVEIAFATATASWGTIVAAAYLTAGGTVLYVFPLAANKLVDDGNTAKLAIGDLTAQLGDPGDSY